MEFTVEGDNANIILKIKGEIISESCHLLREKLMELIKEEKISITLDFAETPFIDSAGLGVLIGIKSTINKRKGTLAIININNRIHEIFTITRMDKLFGLDV